MLSNVLDVVHDDVEAKFVYWNNVRRVIETMKVTVTKSKITTVPTIRVLLRNRIMITCLFLYSLRLSWETSHRTLQKNCVRKFPKIDEQHKSYGMIITWWQGLTKPAVQTLSIWKSWSSISYQQKYTPMLLPTKALYHLVSQKHYQSRWVSH
jgi:uncharacterized membrane protein